MAPETDAIDETETTRSHRLCLIEDQWDVTIAGAGPAGTLCAYLLAREGAKVLLVEKQRFPRHKVCGCCLSARALSALESAGLGTLPDERGAHKLRQLIVAGRGRQLSLPLLNSRSLSRQALDTALMESAVKAGAAFIDDVSAHVHLRSRDDLQIKLRDSGEAERIVNTKLLVVADGLSGTTLGGNAKTAAVVEAGSRIGTGTISDAAPDFYATGNIYMAYAPEGYLGLVRLEDGRTDMAAAFDQQFVREQKTVGRAAGRLLAQAGMPAPADMDSLVWKGTAPLTRHRRKVADERIFVIGDAASYVEPFTGEGIGWALSSAQSLLPLALDAVNCWQSRLARRWCEEHKRTIGEQQKPTRWVARLLRHRRLAALTADVLDSAPFLVQPLVDLVSKP